MESYITLSYLNDFIFCPRSIYFHQLYGSFHHTVYKQAPQYKGTAAHTTVDEQTYSTSAHILMGVDVFSEKYNICGNNFYKRKSLVCDLQEPFRCIIDKQIKKAYGLGQIREDDFLFEKGQYKLQFKQSKEYTRWLLTALLEYKADIFLYCQQYYRAFIRDKSMDQYPVFHLSK